MEKQTVLICDDNEVIHESLSGYLNAEGIGVISVWNGESALRILEGQKVDAVVLDLMLPGLDGFDVCRRIRKTSDVFILILSAKSEELDRVRGLELGADDFIAKPFSPREVTIRLKRALKRSRSGTEPKELRVAELRVLPEYFQVFVGDREVSLTSKEIDVLYLLMRNAGKAVTRDHILNTAWGYEYCGDTRVVDSLIKRMRQKLYGDHIHFAIRSVYGVGYKLETLP